MGYDVGGSGMWGVILTPENIGQSLYDQIEESYGELREKEWDCDDELLEKLGVLHLAEVRAALKMPQRLVPFDAGTPIVLPDGAYLTCTGSEDNYPGRCATPPETFIVGIGMHCEPWLWPQTDSTFRATANLHTWAWGG